MDRKMTTNTPLKTNTRWQRDESSEDKVLDTLFNEEQEPLYYDII